MVLCSIKVVLTRRLSSLLFPFENERLLRLSLLVYEFQAEIRSLADIVVFIIGIFLSIQIVEKQMEKSKRKYENWSFNLVQTTKFPFRAKVLHSYFPKYDDELKLSVNDVIDVIGQVNLIKTIRKKES